MAVCPWHSQDFLSLKSSEKLGSWTPGLSLQWGREGEDARSLSPQRHCFIHWENCDGNLHLKARRWREVHETSTSVSSYRAAVSSMLWESQEHKENGQKGTLGTQPSRWEEGLCSQATKMVWKILLLVPTSLEAKLTGFIFFLERCKRAKSRGS